MNESARCLCGEHDFKSFCKSISAVGRPTRRSIEHICVERISEAGETLVVVDIVGNAFLHTMVRTIVGTLAEVGRGQKDKNWVRDVLVACDRRAAGMCAPAVSSGLARFALLSFSLPIITLILFVVLAQIPKDTLSSNEPCHGEDDNIILFALSLLIPPIVLLQFLGITGLIFYGGIVNNKALTQVGIRNVALLVIGSVLTDLTILFIYLPIYLSFCDWAHFATAAIFQLSSTSMVMVARYSVWKEKQRMTKE